MLHKVLTPVITLQRNYDLHDKESKLDINTDLIATRMVLLDCLDTLSQVFS